jgi:uncharacterized membrane protein YidH (DUF202 family)
MQEKDIPYIDRTGGTTMHRERDARQESPHRIPGGVHEISFDESLLVPRALLRLLDLDKLKEAGWLPLSIEADVARIAAVAPGDPAVVEDVRRTLGVERIDFVRISAKDLAWTIANNEDVNPGFPGLANRTSLAKVRTYLAGYRSFLASRRTVFAKGRTGLSMFRTGLAFITAILLLLRVFGLGWLSVIELGLLAAGLLLLVDGILWYLPARRVSHRHLTSGLPQPTSGVTVLFATLRDFTPIFQRSAPVPGAEALRDGWDELTPVMRRRFLALDRTDMAEERTLLAYFRTLMGKSRTGMALGRTGIGLAGIGSALIRQFSSDRWSLMGWVFIAMGLVMTLEGLSWYLSGRKAGRQSFDSTRQAETQGTPWDLVLPPKTMDPREQRHRAAPKPQGGSMPGIWGTTGLALERTLLAERRNVMARLRTHMSRARTGLAFVRTGMNFSAVGLGLLVSFGLNSPAWSILEGSTLGLGLLLVADGLYWYLPSERIRRSMPYCFHDFEIALPDYTRPVSEWSTAVFSNER